MTRQRRNEGLRRSRCTACQECHGLLASMPPQLTCQFSTFKTPSLHCLQASGEIEDTFVGSFSKASETFQVAMGKCRPCNLWKSILIFGVSC
mmetsp:Transcript_63098/g.159202  ORF Transcript_63098/g.159202 Transcript_63098/m.159202 type:complete len:92 (-) Transcript_63098:165-440(-)